MTTAAAAATTSSSAADSMVEEFCRKRVRRGESFGRMGVDRTISNSLKSPSRRKQKHEEEEEEETKLSVRFAEETPMIYLCSHYEPNMTPTEVEHRKKELFYSRIDFEGFLQERISTVRLLRAVNGDEIALRKHCPDLCLRGLEPYQCETMNQELQCQRLMHLRVVLTEQTLARNTHGATKKTEEEQPATPIADPEVIRQLAEGRSEYARKRARQLGCMDEMEVYPQGTRIAVSKDNLDPRTALMNRRRSLQIASAQRGLENLMLTQRRASSLSNLSVGLPTPRATNTAPLGTATAAAAAAPPAPRRVPVDLVILKEWNAKFLQNIGLKNGQTQGTSAAPNMHNNKSLSDKTAESRRALRDSLLLRKTLLGLSTNATTTTSTTITPSPSTSPSIAQLGLHALAPSSCPEGDHLSIQNASSTTNATSAHRQPSFRFPVRRDSLVGLRRESFLATKQQVQAAAAAVIKVSNATSTATPETASAALATDVAPAAAVTTASLSSSLSSSNHQHQGLGTLAAAAAAVSAATTGSGVSVAEACFRFPVRRDSLSNWS